MFLYVLIFLPQRAADNMELKKDMYITNIRINQNFLPNQEVTL